MFSVIAVRLTQGVFSWVTLLGNICLGNAEVCRGEELWIGESGAACD